MNALPAFLTAHPDAVLVDVVEAKGSTPREAGAFMVVAADALFGTIGGGQLEFLAIDHAHELLVGDGRSSSLHVPLGPRDRPVLRRTHRTCFYPARRAVTASSDHPSRQNWRPPIPTSSSSAPAMWGSRSSRRFDPLPLRVTLIETRDLADGTVPEGITHRRVAMPEAEVATIRPGGAAVILTHDHALDFLIARHALARPDLA